MPTFLTNSLDGLNRGWQQLYGGQQAARPAVTSLYGQPAATPAANPVVLVPAQAATSAPAPIVRNPEVGQPLSGDSSQAAQDNPAARDPLTEYYSAILGLPFIRRMAENTPATPISYNPEMGQTLSDSGGSDGSSAGLLSSGGTSWFQNFIQGLQNAFRGGSSPGQPQYMGYSATQNTPANYFSGGASGGGYEAYAPGMGNYYVGASPGGGMEGYIYPNQAAATAAGDVGAGADAGAPSGGGMSPGQMGSSAIGAIGSGISNIGKNISSTQAKYTPINTPLPERAVFVPPTLASNRNV